MNTACKTLVSAAVLSLLSACATTDGTAVARPGRSIVQNSQYIAVVEDRASHAPERVRVIWVNPPDKRIDPDTGEEVVAIGD
jgi:hypothetical protein